MAEEGIKKRSPYGVFMWGAFLMAVVCFGLAVQRIEAKRPARADIYTIAGILGLLGVAAAWSQGSAHERSRQSQESLQGALERLQDRMQDLPRALMEDSVKLAGEERRERRVDQERQAGELRYALEEGLRTEFAPLAPALSERIGASLGSFSDSLRLDREERSGSLREMAEILSGLQAFQKEWAGSSSALLEKLREQGITLQREISERDAGWRGAMENLSGESAARFQTVADVFLAKMESAVSGVSAASREALENSLREAGAQWRLLQESAGEDRKAWEAAQRMQHELFASEWKDAQSGIRIHFEKAAQILLQGLQEARESLNALSKEASGRIRGSADQAEAWLQSLSQAAGTLEAAAREAQRTGEESVANQAGFKAAVETLNQGLTGMLDRLQSLASLAQGQEALLEKMESTVRRFEERSVELLEENALKLQETFLDALDRVEETDSRGV